MHIALQSALNSLTYKSYMNRAKAFVNKAISAPFSPDANVRLLLVSQSERIPQSQIFPFHHYEADLQRHYKAEVREADLHTILSGSTVNAKKATVVAFQTPFNISNHDLTMLIDRLHTYNPGARLVYLDWSSPTDLRNAERIGPLVDFYIKKHVMSDRHWYGSTTLGDTNLADYYNKRFRLSEPERQFAVPSGFMSKLIVGPPFVTAPLLMPLLFGEVPAISGRPIDLHARFAADGTTWYGAMRSEAEAVVGRCHGVRAMMGTGCKHPRFMAELQKSKICFSPFGYGEVCWRDYEAVVSGAVLVKPDMGHIETNPNIFVPWETYVPLAWDLSDFNEKILLLMSDEALREKLARNAFNILKKWVKSDAFVRDLAPVLQ